MGLHPYTVCASLLLTLDLATWHSITRGDLTHLIEMLFEHYRNDLKRLRVLVFTHWPLFKWPVAKDNAEELDKTIIDGSGGDEEQ
jgi:hypothetical protein